MQKRSLSLAGHRTSVALEPEFWAAIEILAQERGLSIAGFVSFVDRNREGGNLASTLRVAVLKDRDSKIKTLLDASRMAAEVQTATFAGPAQASS